MNRKEFLRIKGWLRFLVADTFRRALLSGLVACILLSLFVSGGNVIVRNGQLNVSGGMYGDSGTFYIDSENDRVGIGTTNPDGKLTVDANSWNTGINTLDLRNSAGAPTPNGSFHIKFGRSTSDRYFDIVFNTTNYGIMGSQTKLTVNRGDTGANLLTIGSNGNVGIGTTSPGWKLTVGSPYSGIHAANEIVTDAGIVAGSSGGLGVGLTSGGGTYGSVYAYNWSTSAAMPLVLNEYGSNVGIGTTSPGAKLDVGGYDLYNYNPNLQFSVNSDNANIVFQGGQYSEQNNVTLDLIGGRGDNGYRYAIRQKGVRTESIGNGARLDFLPIARGNPPTEGDIILSLLDSGNVGIGTTDPGVKLDVVGGGMRIENGQYFMARRNTSDATINVLGFDSETDNLFLRTGGSGGSSRFGIIRTDDTEIFTVLNSGYVGIGTTSPGYKLHVRPSTNRNLVISTGGMASGVKIVSINDTIAEQPLAMQGSTTSLMTNGADRLYITNGGNVGIGTTTPELKLDVEGDIEIGTGTTGCVRDSDNTTIAGTCSSDIRLKTDIESLDGVLENVSRLRPVSFKWIGGNATEYGLVAQEVREVLPELVAEDEEGYLRVSYDSKLFMLMLESIKELEEENDRKDAEILELRQAVCELNPGAAFCAGL